MAYTTNDAKAIVARARRFTKYLPVGYCCNFVWNCVTNAGKTYGLPDADAAWSRATQREYDRTPPAGAPVYWGVGQYGHIAVSVGGGKVRSTDWPANGQVGECTLQQMEKRWRGMVYRGWSRDFAGDPIKGLEKPKPAPAPAFGSLADITGVNLPKGVDVSQVRRGKRNAEVARVQSAIWNWRGAEFRKQLVKRYPGLRRADFSIAHGGFYGPITDFMVRDTYDLLIRMEGKAKWGKVDPQIGPMLLDRIGFKKRY